jgi:hypothetical protein
MNGVFGASDMPMPRALAEGAAAPAGMACPATVLHGSAVWTD